MGGFSKVLKQSVSYEVFGIPSEINSYWLKIAPLRTFIKNQSALFFVKEGI